MKFIFTNLQLPIRLYLAFPVITNIKNNSLFEVTAKWYIFIPMNELHGVYFNKGMGQSRLLDGVFIK